MYFYLYKDSQGQWRWSYHGNNNKIIAVSSESYINKGDCEHSIQLVKGANSAPVYER